MSTETKKPFVMGFIGRSGSGKTTLAAAVLRILAARSWRVCAVKDAHHHIDLDTPGQRHLALSRIRRIACDTAHARALGGLD